MKRGHQGRAYITDQRVPAHEVRHRRFLESLTYRALSRGGDGGPPASVPGGRPALRRRRKAQRQARQIQQRKARSAR